MFFGKRKTTFAVLVGICLFQLGGCGKKETSTVVDPAPLIPTSNVPEVTPPNTPVTTIRPSTPAAPRPAEPQPPVAPTPPVVVSPPPTVQPPMAPQPTPRAPTAIDGTFIRMATLEVEGYPDKTVGFDVGVKGQVTGEKVQCEFITEHQYIRTDAKWSPVPISLYSVTETTRKLSPLFEQTLDFPDGEKRLQKDRMSVLVDFVRGKIFRSMLAVRAYAYKKDAGGFGCHCFLTICLNPKSTAEGYTCTAGWRKLERLSVVIDRGRHLLAFREAERDKDDLVKMLISVKNLDENGFPSGQSFSEDFTDFISR